MQVLHKRQTGESAVPTALTYGEIAIDKRGYLHTADETGTVCDPLTPVKEMITATQYDVKMVQLTQAMEKKEPPMLGGFVEAFGDTKKRQTATKCTVNTSTHQLRFDGDNRRAEITYFSADDTGIGAYTSASVSGVMACPAGMVSVEYVELGVGFMPHLPHDASNFNVTAYGRTNASSGGTALAAQIVHIDEFGITVRIDNPPLYPYYAVTISNSAGYGYEGGQGKGNFTSVMTDSEGRYPGVTGEISSSSPATAAADGYYITKVIDLGVPVEEGELYLHYPALPAGATLSVKLGTTTNNQVELTPVGEEHPVTVGGKSLRERKYRIPAFAEAVTGVSVRVDGHREQLSDVLALSDICVCMR